MPTICAKSTLLFGKVTITELGRLLLPQLLLLRVFVATTFCSGMANPRSVGFDEVTVERVVRRSRFSRVAFKAACRLSGFFVVLGGASLLMVSPRLPHRLRRLRRTLPWRRFAPSARRRSRRQRQSWSSRTHSRTLRSHRPLRAPRAVHR